MDMSQFPEHHRAYVLSGVVRNNRQGIAVRFNGLEGKTLRLTVHCANGHSQLPHPELKAKARAAFSDLPYDLRLEAE